MPVKIRNIFALVLLFILLFTAIAAVLANLSLFGLDPNSNFAKTSLVAVLVEIVSAVIFVWKTGALQQNSVSATINFSIDGQTADINLDQNQCTYEVRNMKSEIKDSGKVNVVWGMGGWECKFPSPTDFDESITLNLTEKNGKEWEVRPFYPLSRNVSAILREDIE